MSGLWPDHFSRPRAGAEWRNDVQGVKFDTHHSLPHDQYLPCARPTLRAHRVRSGALFGRSQREVGCGGLDA